MILYNDHYKKRREKFQSLMKENSIALIFTGSAPARTGGLNYRFRPGSDFFYLTGFDEEQAVLLLTKNSSSVFVLPSDPKMETWYGYRTGVQNAAERIGVDTAEDVSKFDQKLFSILKGYTTLYYEYGAEGARDNNILYTIQDILKDRRSGQVAPVEILHVAPLLHEMRMFKDELDMELIRKAASITREAHIDLFRKTKVNMFEYELEALLLYHFKKHGATEAYPSIVASGKNACTLHYEKNSKQLKHGELILVDAGAEFHVANCDVSRTFPVDEKFTPPQKDIYSLVLSANQHAISDSVKGNTLDKIHQATIRRLIEGLLDLKIIKGSVESIFQQETYQRFYMHGTSHWLGLDVHDVGFYQQNGNSRVLKEGMVFTIEPGLYIPDDDDIPKNFRNTGIRIEDNVRITDAEPENLTIDIPKSIDEIEMLRREA